MWIWQCQTLAAWYKWLVHIAHTWEFYISNDCILFYLCFCILAEGIVHILYDTYVKHFADRENGENKSFGRLETTYMFKPTHLFIFISDGISMKSLFSCKLKFLVKCYFFCMSLYSYDYSECLIASYFPLFFSYIICICNI